MAIKDILSQMTTSTSSYTHRGADIGYAPGGYATTTSGTHLHVGTYGTPTYPGGAIGAPGIWSAAEIEDFRAKAREEGRREALRTLWDRMPNMGQVGTLVNTGETISLMNHSNEPATAGVNIVLVHKDFLFPESASKEVPTIVSEAIKELETGWYQDDEANLYYYEGNSRWKGINSMKNKELTEQAIIGKLEYLDEN